MDSVHTRRALGALGTDAPPGATETLRIVKTPHLILYRTPNELCTVGRYALATLRLEPPDFFLCAPYTEIFSKSRGAVPLEHLSTG